MLPPAAPSLQGADDQSPRFRGRDARKAGDGRGQKSHDMADRQGAVVEQDARQMVLGQQARSNGTGRVHVRQAIRTGADHGPMVRMVLGLGVFDGILQVQIGIEMHRSGRGWRSARHPTAVALGQNGWGDGVGRSG